MKYTSIQKSAKWIGSLGFLALSVIASPASAAEQIYAQYSVLEVTIPVTELEEYAKEGRLSDTLAPYAEYLKPEQLQQLRSALTTKINIPPQQLSTLLATPIGETLLAHATTIIQPKSGGASTEALSTALVSAAADPEGLTLLSLMRHFPDTGMQVDISEGMALFQSVEQLMQQTQSAAALVQQQSTSAVKAQPANASILQTLQKPGSFTWDTQTLQLQDQTPKRLQLTNKVRQFPADLYLPKRTDPAPVIVISHGFSADRSTYISFAQHLASHGFAVAVPEHPGSSATQVQAMLASKGKDLPQTFEFVDRPLDISFLLDELTQRATELGLQGRLNLDQVGVVGHSYGGYTALALGGGTINFKTLGQSCGPQEKKTLNVSQVLQCEAADLPERDYNLSDARVKAVFAISPFTRSIFGQKGLGQVKLPVMMLSASLDTVAPSLLEQIQPFTWLPETHKYLVIMESAGHFSTSDARRTNNIIWKLPKSLVGANPQAARVYLKVLGTAFFQDHLLQSSPTVLSPNLVQTLSQPSLPLSMIRTLSSQDLQPVVDNTASKP